MLGFGALSFDNVPLVMKGGVGVLRVLAPGSAQSVLALLKQTAVERPPLAEVYEDDAAGGSIAVFTEGIAKLAEPNNPGYGWVQNAVEGGYAVLADFGDTTTDSIRIAGTVRPNALAYFAGPKRRFTVVAAPDALLAAAVDLGEVAENPVAGSAPSAAPLPVVPMLLGLGVLAVVTVAVVGSK